MARRPHVTLMLLVGIMVLFLTMRRFSQDADFGAALRGEQTPPQPPPDRPAPIPDEPPAKVTKPEAGPEAPEPEPSKEAKKEEQKPEEKTKSSTAASASKTSASASKTSSSAKETGSALPPLGSMTPIAPKLENATLKAELGRSSWRLLHTMMARFPEEATEDEQTALRSYIGLFARLYPCGDCSRHFLALLEKYPPQVSGRNGAAGWACFVHNQVNERLGKPEFDCAKIGDFYDCGCGDDDEKKKKERKEKGKAGEKAEEKKEGKKEVKAEEGGDKGKEKPADKGEKKEEKKPEEELKERNATVDDKAPAS